MFPILRNGLQFSFLVGYFEKGAETLPWSRQSRKCPSEKSVAERTVFFLPLGADVFGHSLGGSLAEKSGAKGKITTYNKGVGLFDIGRKVGSNQVDHRSKNDVVSLLSLTQLHHNKLREYDSGKKPLDILGNHTYE